MPLGNDLSSGAKVFGIGVIVMALPDSYTFSPGSIPAYFEAMLGADAPDRFSTRFLETLEFKSTNDGRY